MKDKATIEIDCFLGVVSVNSDSTVNFSMSGQSAIKTSLSTLIAECLYPQIRELMALSMDELKERSLIAMGIKP
jgi:hypothetical protein